MVVYAQTTTKVISGPLKRYQNILTKSLFYFIVYLHHMRLKLHTKFNALVHTIKQLKIRNKSILLTEKLTTYIK